MVKVRMLKRKNSLVRTSCLTAMLNGQDGRSEALGGGRLARQVIATNTQGGRSPIEHPNGSPGRGRRRAGGVDVPLLPAIAPAVAVKAQPWI